MRVGMRRSEREVTSMQYVPKKHQQIAADFLASHNRCALFLDMG